MPVWGNRFVCETANYKHIEEKKKEFLQREDSLGRWVKEKQERKLNLQRMNERLRQGSICSTMSTIDSDNQHGSLATELSEIEQPNLSPSIPDAPPPTAKLDLQTSDPFTRRNSAPLASTNSRPSSAGVIRSGSLGSSIDENDRTRIFGGGRHFEYPCGQCIIQ